MSETDRSPDYFIASSFMADEPYERKFGLLPTAQYAVEIHADGTQDFINFDRFAQGLDDPGEVREFHQQHSLEMIIHTPGKTTKASIRDEVAPALQIAIDMADPLPNLGAVVCIVHHDPFRMDSIQEIEHAFDNALKETKGKHGRSLITPNIKIAIENFYPKPEDLPSQIDIFNEDFEYLQRAGLPVMRVFDIDRLYPRVDGKVDEDPDNKKLQMLLEPAKGEKIIIHATDKYKMDKSMREEGNAARVGTGKHTERFQLLTRLAQKYGIEFVCVVDESEKKLITSPEELEDSRRVFQR